MSSVIKSIAGGAKSLVDIAAPAVGYYLGGPAGAAVGGAAAGAIGGGGVTGAAEGGLLGYGGGELASYLGAPVAGGAADIGTPAATGGADYFANAGITTGSADTDAALGLVPGVGSVLAGGSSGLTDVLGSTSLTNPPPASVPGAGTVTGTGAGATAPPTPAPTGGPTSPSGGPGAAGGFTDFLKANKNLILPGLSLGASLLTQPKIPNMQDLTTLAQQEATGTGSSPAATTAASLIPTVSTGQLPPSAQAGIQQGLNDAIAAIKSKYAQLGLSGSTMETQEIQAANQAAQAQAFQEANALTQTGLQAAGVASGQEATAATIYDNIIQTTLAQDKALQEALANFSSASSIGALASSIASK